jgi:hypothetical protein
MKKVQILLIVSLLSITACSEKKTERLEVQKVTPVLIPDRKVDVNVHTDARPAPIVINRETSTNTTTEKNNETGVTTETKTESTSVH